VSFFWQPTLEHRIDAYPAGRMAVFFVDRAFCAILADPLIIGIIPSHRSLANKKYGKLRLRALGTRFTRDAGIASLQPNFVTIMIFVALSRRIH